MIDGVLGAFFGFISGTLIVGWFFISWGDQANKNSPELSRMKKSMLRLAVPVLPVVCAIGGFFVGTTKVGAY